MSAINCSLSSRSLYPALWFSYTRRADHFRLGPKCQLSSCRRTVRQSHSLAAVHITHIITIITIIITAHTVQQKVTLLSSACRRVVTDAGAPTFLISDLAFDLIKHAPAVGWAASAEQICRGQASRIPAQRQSVAIISAAYAILSSCSYAIVLTCGTLSVLSGLTSYKGVQ